MDLQMAALILQMKFYSIFQFKTLGLPLSRQTMGQTELMYRITANIISLSNNTFSGKSSAMETIFSKQACNSVKVS